MQTRVWDDALCEVFEKWLCLVPMDQGSADGNAAHSGLLSSARLPGGFRWNLGEIRCPLARCAKTSARLISWLVSHTAVMHVPWCFAVILQGALWVLKYALSYRIENIGWEKSIFLCISICVSERDGKTDRRETTVKCRMVLLKLFKKLREWEPLSAYANLQRHSVI